MAKFMEVDPSELIDKVSAELKNEPKIKAPEWAAFAKTGMHKERPPEQEWWHIRAAALLRSVAKLGPVGVSKLRIKYGGKKNRGHKPERFYKGSGSVARKVLQQLENAGLVRQTAVGSHKGRVITKKAAEIMNAAAMAMSKQTAAGASAAKASAKAESKESAKAPTKTEPKKAAQSQ
ncbi:30S ribosomal protein S19e [Candidatus Woesearchaeota archaeon]|nr:30S ribosomal protein S19e [Candidatus Woesearchaeota archaeon]